MVNIGETKLKSYGELYKAIVESIGKDEAGLIIGPLVDVAEEIAIIRIRVKCAERGVDFDELLGPI